MDLNAVAMFVAVVRAGSLSAAASATRTPLATLSRNVRELEEQLGARLLERSARGTRLTEAGKSLYEHASQAVDALADGALAVKARRGNIAGRLRLSLPPAFEPWWALLAAFQREHPAVEVSVQTTDRAVDVDLEGVDVALRIGATVHERLIARRLVRYRHVLVASPIFLREHGAPADPAALASLPCAMWRKDAAAPDVWMFGANGVRPRAVLTSNEYPLLRARALAGEVITELPPFLAREALRDGRLVMLLPDHPFPELDVSLLYARQRQPTRAVRAYLDHCARHAPSYLGDGA